MSTTRPARDGSHDFDFHIGRWRIHNERLTARLQGGRNWETFEARQHAPPARRPWQTRRLRHRSLAGFVGMSLRLYSPLTRQWSIYWVNNQGGVLEPPVVGSFANGVGVFEGRDELDGRPITVRFLWSNIPDSTARWEQAFSPDDGRTWETNWTMTLTREPEGGTV